MIWKTVEKEPTFMRVISGKAKGRRLKTLKGTTTRPTTDRVKENLFNIIAPRLPEARFLDLFAGSGAIGIEALSRGAVEVVFVEKNRQASAVIRENLALTRLDGDVLTMDVSQAIERLGKKGHSFDLIFLDPPYDQGFVEITVAQIAQSKLLADNGLLVAEYGKKEEIITPLWNLHLVRQQIYGDTCLGFFAWNG